MWPFRRRRPQRGPGIPLPPHWGPAYKALWDRYVPARGQADTIQGELIRAAARLRSECDRNGMINWPEYREHFEAFCQFIRTHLEDGTLPARASDFVRETMQRVVEVGRWQVEQWAREDEDPEYEAPGGEPEPDFAEERLFEIERLVELWCDAHPEAIPREVSDFP